MRAACEGLHLLFGFWSDNRTEIDQRPGHRESLNSIQRNGSVESVIHICWLAILLHKRLTEVNSHTNDPVSMCLLNGTGEQKQ